MYPRVFVGADLGSIVLQAIGGGVAASAGNNGANAKLLKAGDDLIVAGISFQVGTMVVCAMFILDYALRFHRARKHNSASSGEKQSAYEVNKTDARTTRRLKLFCWSTGVAYLTVLIRCIYR